MNTTNNKVLLASVVGSAFGLIALSKTAASAVSVMMIASGYIAVALLVVLVVMNYRVGPKNYSAR